jgi:hypothetical protein
MATELTVKERAFAQLIIEGTKTAAYRKVYSSKGNATTQATNAYKLSKRPKIKAEVARLLRQREFPADDYARIRDLAVAGLTEIFLQESDPRLRAKVGSVLLAYADAGLKLHAVPTEKERKYDELTQFLEGVVNIQRDAASQEPAMTLETVRTKAPLVEVEPDDEPSNEGNPETLEPTETDDSITAEVYVDSSAEDLRSLEEVRMEPIPGFFPPKFRRVQGI